MPGITHTQKQGPWFIVNMTKRWEVELVVRGRKPTRIHQTFTSAVTEAARLADKFPGHHWAVFECIGYFEQKKSPAARTRSTAGHMRAEPLKGPEVAGLS